MVLPPEHHFIKFGQPHFFVSGNLLPLIVPEVFVNRPLPSPNTEPLAMKLVAPILGSNGSNPVPIAVLQHFMSEPGWVILRNPCNMASPLEHKPVIPHVPVNKSVRNLDEFDSGIGADHEFLFRLERFWSVTKHLV